MDIDRRLHEAGHQWRQSQGPALPAPKLDTPQQKPRPRWWTTGLVPLTASAAVAAMVIGVVVLHNTPASHQVPGGATSTSSPTSFPTSAPTASTPAPASSTVAAPPSTAVASPSVAGKGAAAAPKPHKSTTPTVDTGIEAYGDCTKPRVQPVEIVLTCADHGVILQGLHWTSWTSTSAKAVGTLRYNDCKPSCAMGKIHYVPDARVILTDPVRGAGGQMLWSLVDFSPRPPGWDTDPFPLPIRPN